MISRRPASCSVHEDGVSCASGRIATRHPHADVEIEGRNVKVLMIGAGVVLSLIATACGSSTKSPPATQVTVATARPVATGTLAVTPASAPSPQPTSPPSTPPAVADPRLTVLGGKLGLSASATMHIAPGSSCSIIYLHPAGKVSTAKGLGPKTAGTNGVVEWTWLINRGTAVGTGSVTVTCGAERASAPITISPN